MNVPQIKNKTYIMEFAPYIDKLRSDIKNIDNLNTLKQSKMVDKTPQRVNKNIENKEYYITNTTAAITNTTAAITNTTTAITNTTTAIDSITSYCIQENNMYIIKESVSILQLMKIIRNTVEPDHIDTDIDSDIEYEDFEN